MHQCGECVFRGEACGEGEAPLLSGGGRRGKEEREENIQVRLNPHRELQLVVCATGWHNCQIESAKGRARATPLCVTHCTMLWC